MNVDRMRKYNARTAEVAEPRVTVWPASLAQAECARNGHRQTIETTTVRDFRGLPSRVLTCPCGAERNVIYA